MPEVTRERAAEIVRVAFAVLLDHPDGLQVRFLIEEVKKTLPLTLIDLERLFDLWVQHYDQLPDVDQQRLPIRPVYFLSPADR